MRPVALRTIITCFVLVALLAVPFGSSALAQDDPFLEENDTTAGLMTVDLLLVRPVGIGATILGSVVFVLALPFTAATDDVNYSMEKLVKEPARYTFKRSLGFF